MSNLLDIARAEIGYLEKASPAELDSKTANAGSGNFTKYWRDVFPNYQGQPWCDCFVSWCFLMAYGKAGADALLCGGLLSFYTPVSASNYKAARRWSFYPEVGAQIFFKNSVRIYHTGIVESYTDTTVTTIEGNTDTGEGVIANGGGVWRKTYQRKDPRIAGYGCPTFKEEKMIYTTPAKWISQVRKAYLYGHNNCHYGDSHGTPPCSDGFMSCDRMIALAAYNTGWRDQPAGGITVLNMEAYLLKWGWSKITKQADLQKGDIVLMKSTGTDRPTAAWHTFALTAYDPATKTCSKYDAGSEARLRASQPFTGVPLNEWGTTKSFYCGFRCPEKKSLGKYEISTAEVRQSSEGSHVKLMQILLRGRGYKGKDGKLLQRDGIAGTNTIYALKKFQAAHSLPETGICDRKTWAKLSGRKTTDA